MERSYLLPQAGITHPLINDLVKGLQHTFSDGKVAGIYLGGSIATGDFNERASDLDFLIVLDSPATDAEVSQLRG